MTAEQLREFIVANIEMFFDVKVLNAGVAFHYTQHAATIESEGRFLGAPIDKDLDQTQRSLESKPAEHNPGVVFAYDDIQSAKEEGFDCEILRIEYDQAVSAFHMQEHAIGAGCTLMILTSDIKEFERLGPAESCNLTG